MITSVQGLAAPRANICIYSCRFVQIQYIKLYHSQSKRKEKCCIIQFLLIVNPLLSLLTWLLEHYLASIPPIKLALRRKGDSLPASASFILLQAVWHMDKLYCQCLALSPIDGKVSQKLIIRTEYLMKPSYSLDNFQSHWMQRWVTQWSFSPTILLISQIDFKIFILEPLRVTASDENMRPIRSLCAWILPRESPTVLMRNHSIDLNKAIGSKHTVRQPQHSFILRAADHDVESYPVKALLILKRCQRRSKSVF